MDAATQRRVADSLALAQQLGGVPMTFKGPDFPSAVAAFVRRVRHHPRRPGPVAAGRGIGGWFGPSLLDRLLGRCPGVDVVVVDTSGVI